MTDAPRLRLNGLFPVLRFGAALAVLLTAPVTLPIYGKANFRETTKEKLMEFWTEVLEDTGLEINYEERVTDIAPEGEGFVVTSTKGTYRTRSVLLTIGRRGTPRKLGVEGEEPELAYAMRTIGNEPFVWSSDFPHEVNTQACADGIQEIVDNEELTDDDLEAILYRNAARLYGFKDTRVRT